MSNLHHENNIVSWQEISENEEEVGRTATRTVNTIEVYAETRARLLTPGTDEELETANAEYIGQ